MKQWQSKMKKGHSSQSPAAEVSLDTPFTFSLARATRLYLSLAKGARVWRSSVGCGWGCRGRAAAGHMVAQQRLSLYSGFLSLLCAPFSLCNAPKLRGPP